MLELLGGVVIVVSFALVCIALGLRLARVPRHLRISAASVILGPFYRTLAGHGGPMRTLQLAVAMDDKSSADVNVKYPLQDSDGQDIVGPDGTPWRPAKDTFTFESSDQLRLGLGKDENQPPEGEGVLVVGRSGKIGGGSSAIVIPAPDGGDPFRIEIAAAIANAGIGAGSVMISTRPETEDEAGQS